MAAKQTNVFYNVYYGLVVNLKTHFDDDCQNVSPKTSCFL